MKTNIVKMSIINQGLFFERSDRSSLIDDFCSKRGMMRSLVVKKVMSSMIVPIAANHVITASIPTALSPLPAYSIIGSIKTCTKNWANITATNRYDEILFLSPMSPVSTPLSAAYGRLLEAYISNRSV